MIRRAALAVLLVAAAPPVSAQREGRLATLPLGRYLCELPGDATGPASRPLATEWFDVINASSYVAAGGTGTYLLTGETVVFTRGPMRGARFERVSDRTLRRTDLAGPLAKLRCVRSGRSAISARSAAGTG